VIFPLVECHTGRYWGEKERTVFPQCPGKPSSIGRKPSISNATNLRTGKPLWLFSWSTSFATGNRSLSVLNYVSSPPVWTLPT
jgi:hypothetical protein